MSLCQSLLLLYVFLQHPHRSVSHQTFTSATASASRTDPAKSSKFPSLGCNTTRTPEPAISSYHHVPSIVSRSPHAPQNAFSPNTQEASGRACMLTHEPSAQACSLISRSHRRAHERAVVHRSFYCCSLPAAHLHCCPSRTCIPSAAEAFSPKIPHAGNSQKPFPRIIR